MSSKEMLNYLNTSLNGTILSVPAIILVSFFEYRILSSMHAEFFHMIIEYNTTEWIHRLLDLLKTCIHVTLVYILYTYTTKKFIVFLSLFIFHKMLLFHNFNFSVQIIHFHKSWAKI